jgi:hypothetical protein
LLGAPISLVERPVLDDLARPDLVGEHARVRPQRHAGVDQRSAAEPAPDEHVHVLAEAHVEERRVRAHAVGLAANAELVLELGEPRRELSGEELAAALEDGDALARARKAGSGDAAAVAGTDHDHVVAGLECRQRPAQPGH